MKTKMLISIILFVCTKASGQILPIQPVTDPVSHAHLIKTLAESYKQTEALDKNLDIIKEQKEHLEKVSNAVFQLRYVERIISNNKRLVTIISRGVEILKKSNKFSSSEITTINYSLTAILNQSIENLGVAKKLTKDDFFTMSDAERVKLLRETEEISSEGLESAKLRINHYNKILEYREVTNAINNRKPIK